MIWKGILEYIQKEQRKDRAPALGWSEHSLLLPLSPAVVTEWCLTSVLQVLWSCRSCSQTPSPAHCMWFSCLRLMEERQSAGGASSSEMKKCLPVAKGGVCFRRCINVFHEPESQYDGMVPSARSIGDCALQAICVSIQIPSFRFVCISLDWLSEAYKYTHVFFLKLLF